jgi:hypothetical protein
MAATNGLSVSVLADRLEPDRHVWVQFGGGTVVEGAPCACGSNDIQRVNRTWTRCGNCGSLLESIPTTEAAAMPTAPPPPPDRPEGPSVGHTRLDIFERVVLFRHSGTRSVERCLGVGTSRRGKRAMLSVEFPLANGQRIPHPDVDGEWLYTLHEIPIGDSDPLEDALSDLGLRTRVDWRMSDDIEDADPEDPEGGPAPG